MSENPRHKFAVETRKIKGWVAAPETPENLREASIGEPTSKKLAAEFVAGRADAALALAEGYGDFIDGVAAQYGTSVAFDREDAKQTALAVLLTVAREVCQTGAEFRKTFMDRAREELRGESNKYLAGVTLPTTTLRRVVETAKRFGGNAQAAREYLADEAPAGQRVTRETFDSVWLLAHGVHLEWSEPAGDKGLTVGEVVADRPADGFQDIENSAAVGWLLSLPHPTMQDRPILTDEEREVIARIYGLDGHPAALYDKKTDRFISATSAIVGAQMGMRAESIRRIHSRCIAKLQIHAEDLM
jgi:hypothetical protein